LTRGIVTQAGAHSSAWRSGGRHFSADAKEPARSAQPLAQPHPRKLSRAAAPDKHSVQIAAFNAQNATFKAILSAQFRPPSARTTSAPIPKMGKAVLVLGFLLTFEYSL